MKTVIKQSETFWNSNEIAEKKIQRTNEKEKLKRWKDYYKGTIFYQKCIFTRAKPKKAKESLGHFFNCAGMQILHKPVRKRYKIFCAM